MPSGNVNLLNVELTRDEDMACMENNENNVSGGDLGSRSIIVYELYMKLGKDMLVRVSDELMESSFEDQSKFLVEVIIESGIKNNADNNGLDNTVKKGVVVTKVVLHPMIE